MRVCIVAEGSYPFVVGGVSSWVHSLIRLFPKTEFVILAIAASRAQRGKYAYPLPANVQQVHELYLQDADWEKRRFRPQKMRAADYAALQSLVRNENPQWEVLFDYFQREKPSLNALLMGEDFLNAVRECYDARYAELPFTDLLWTMRSLYLPLFLTMEMEIPQADLYHCVATGYAGVLGCMAKHRYGSGLLLSEHGIYTRERQEELIRAGWLREEYKGIWIEQFEKLSTLAYRKGDLVTSLFEQARALQLASGCPQEKTRVIPNGVCVQRFQQLAGKRPEEAARVNIGAVLRVTPIKDVKTMLRAFALAKAKAPGLKLWIMGPLDEDEAYAQECFALVKTLGLPDVEFTGQVDVREHLGRMDMLLLTSISEGQPLAILEGFAGHVPVIATDVGNCAGLVYGEQDDFGPAGEIVHIMNTEEIADAILKLAQDRELRLQMGENGYRRVMAGYRLEQMQEAYRKIYHSFAAELPEAWTEEAPPCASS